MKQFLKQRTPAWVSPSIENQNLQADQVAREESTRQNVEDGARNVGPSGSTGRNRDWSPTK